MTAWAVPEVLGSIASFTFFAPSDRDWETEEIDNQLQQKFQEVEQLQSSNIGNINPEQFRSQFEFINNEIKALEQMQSEKAQVLEGTITQLQGQKPNIGVRFSRKAQTKKVNQTETQIVTGKPVPFQTAFVLKP